MSALRENESNTFVFLWYAQTNKTDNVGCTISTYCTLYCENSHIKKIYDLLKLYQIIISKNQNKIFNSCIYCTKILFIKLSKLKVLFIFFYFLKFL